MCVKVATPKEEILKELLSPYGVQITSYKHYFHANGFDRPYLPILANDTSSIIPAKWKLIPHWVKNDEEASKYANTLNARCEDLFDKASYSPYTGNRCLLWVDGFFESQHPTSKTTVPHYIYSKDRLPFAIGCIYSDWLDTSTGEVVRTFSIVTTPPNTLLREIHNVGQRMPLIIPPDRWEYWLIPMNQASLNSLMQPLPDGILDAYPVSGLVNKRGDTNVPETQVGIKLNALPYH